MKIYMSCSSFKISSNPRVGWKIFVKLEHDMYTGVTTSTQARHFCHEASLNQNNAECLEIF